MSQESPSSNNIDSKEILDQNKILVFGKLDRIDITENKRKKVLFEFQRDMNDYILAKYLREGNHFHVPFFNYDKEGNFYLDRSKKQTIIDAKTFNLSKIRKDTNLELTQLKKVSEPLYKSTKEIRENMIFAVDELLKEGREKDVTEGNRHEYVRFADSELYDKVESKDITKKDKILRGDYLRSLYNMLGHQRMKYFSQVDGGDKLGPTLEINKLGKSYLLKCVRQLVEDYKLESGYDIQKVFSQDTLDLIEAIDENHITTPMILNIMGELLQPYLKNKGDKRVRGEMIAHKGTALNILLAGFYLDDKYDLSEVKADTDKFNKFILSYPAYSELERKFGIKLMFESREKTRFSMIKKLLRSSDIETMTDQIGGRWRFHPRPTDPKNEAILLKELSKITMECMNQFYTQNKIDFGFHERDKDFQISGQGDYEFDDDIKSTIAGENSFKLDFYHHRKEKGSSSAVKGGNDYTSLKIKSTYRQKFKNEICGIEIQMMPLLSDNDRNKAAKEFNERQKNIELYARTRVIFSWDDYLNHHYSALSKKAKNLMDEKKKIDKIHDTELQQLLLTKREEDCIYQVKSPVQDERSIDLRQFAQNDLLKSRDSVRIAFDQILAETQGEKPRYFKFVYFSDIQTQQQKELDSDSGSLKTLVLETPLNLQDLEDNKDLFFISSNKINALTTGRIPGNAHLREPSADNTSRAKPIAVYDKAFELKPNSITKQSDEVIKFLTKDQASEEPDRLGDSTTIIKKYLADMIKRGY